MSTNHEARRRMVTDGISKLKWNKPQKLSSPEALQAKIQETANRVYQTIRPILKAGGGFDKPALEETLFKLHFDEYTKLSKDELLTLCSFFSTAQAMQVIDANPSGADKPDALGGV